MKIEVEGHVQSMHCNKHARTKHPSLAYPRHQRKLLEEMMQKGVKGFKLLMIPKYFHVTQDFALRYYNLLCSDQSGSQQRSLMQVDLGSL